ncbi:MAG TPA: amino acid ABC transporter substrate-binding protein [Pseudolabrys sp.]|uniref:amino acid ABC transporter substrate-binding protein n=1 Tax=Pseudolabrys sp. TaxID=1960880 RepID=UPI002DDD477F|nr:amino acid ABC transporter substrate-binding protein [Pseudolabrys sp.]HEV2629204.1 amino acid ABC transporter substrate-binding protein [Pseudolabrys sp.]
MIKTAKRNCFAAGAAVVSALAFVTPGHAADPIKLGAPVALTGSLADEGGKLLHGYEMCVDAVNAKGGVKVGGEMRKIDLVKYDYQSDTNKASQMIQRMATVDKVDFVMAPYNSGATKVTAVTAERYDLPMMSTAAATPSVFDQHFKNLYGILFPNEAISDAEAAYYKKAVPGLKTVAIIAMNSLFPKAIGAQLKKSAEKEGLQTVYDGLYSPDTLDFSNVLTEIKAKNPDWIYATGFIQELVLMRKQMASLGLNPKIVTMNAAAAYREYQRNLGPLADHVTSSAWWHGSVNYQDAYIFGDTKKYDEVFQAKYKQEPSYLEAAATAGCEVLAESVEEAKTTEHAAVRKVLSSKTFNTFYGPVKFGPDGQNKVASPVILQIQNGNFTVLAPDSVKTGNVETPLQK